ncbi:unnamed protein product [Rotaria magnacalcarata]|uniref:Uncharacterized protein n=1 Tax=Rotaria magnacalcarata TaxID=392030 RepID=A0A816XYH8_9BILA|nr:unnamed protein product [Rotaria magnacalcarata]
MRMGHNINSKYFNDRKADNSNTYQIDLNCLSNLTEKLAEQNDIELTQSSNDSSNNEQTLLTCPISNGERKRSLFNGGSTHSIRTSTSSLHKAAVYTKFIKRNSGLSTIKRLHLSGSPFRLLSSSSTYARTTSFLKSNMNNDHNVSIIIIIRKAQQKECIIMEMKSKKLDSLKARCNSRHTDDDDNNNNEKKSRLTMTTRTNRFRHVRDSDLTSEHTQVKENGP